MNDLIEALQIFSKYTKPYEYHPTHCSYNVLMVICKKDISQEDEERVKKLSFLWNDYDNCWVSYRFGRA